MKQKSKYGFFTPIIRKNSKQTIILIEPFKIHCHYYRNKNCDNFYRYDNLKTGLILSVNFAAENKVDLTDPYRDDVVVVVVVAVLAPLLPFAVARSYCAADGRCSYGSGGCWDWNKPSCRCYRLVPCWAWCARSVCAASTALRKSGFCCKAHIETHRSCCFWATDLAAEPDTGCYFCFFLFTFFFFSIFFYYLLFTIFCLLSFFWSIIFNSQYLNWYSISYSHFFFSFTLFFDNISAYKIIFISFLSIFFSCQFVFF